jgi:hypothetical protein
VRLTATLMLAFASAMVMTAGATPAMTSVLEAIPMFGWL